MRILFVTNMYPVPDYIYFGIHVKEQIDALQKEKNIDADVYFINGREKKTNYFKSISQIKRKIENGNYDLIHIHYGISGLFLLFYKPAIPVVITLHSGELYQKKGFINHLMQKSLTMAIVKKVDKIVVLNDDMITLLEDYRSKLVKLPCGSNLQIFKEKTVSKNTNHILIGFPGNKDRKEKNYELFASIVTSLKKSYNIDIIEFHGLTRDQVVDKLNEIDVLLMTSKVEGSPQIIKEAMGCNKPIVSTPVGDVMDVLQDVKNAYVVNSFSSEPFIGPLKQIIDLPPDKRVSNGREKLINLGLDSTSVSEKLYVVYEDLV